MSDRQEARLLLAILRDRWDEAGTLAARRPPDAATFLGLCRRCDVHPWVHSLLEARGAFDLVGDEILEGLAEMRRKVRADNLLLLARVEQALDLLHGAGIVPLALKGLDTLHRFYARFDERTLDDVDLLVRERDFARAVSVLEAAGWVPPPEPERTHWLRSSFELPLRSPGPIGVDFEIHWTLGQERRYRVDPATLLARAQPLDVGGRRILRLEDHDAAAHLLVHHLQHYFDRRLKWALDLRHLASPTDFDWSLVARRLREWGALGAAGLSLLHLRRVLPEAAPAAALEAIPASRWRRVLASPLRSAHPLDLYRGTRSRWVQLYLAAVALERPGDLPLYLRHRAVRDRVAGGPDGRSGTDRPGSRGAVPPG